MSVRFGLGLGTQRLLDEPSAFAVVVDALEHLRFDSLWLSERATGPTLGPLAALAFVGARTRKLKFGTSVLVVPGRNPVLLAKELATIDALSNGRLLLAFGLGTRDDDEHRAFGVDPGDRTPWFEEAVPLMRRLWREESVDHEGPRFSTRGLTIYPRPVGRMEVWLGGKTPVEHRRAGRLADGWLGSFMTPDESARARARIIAEAARHDRAIDDDHYGAVVFYTRGESSGPVAELARKLRPDLDPRDLVPEGADELKTRLTAYVDAGVSKFVLVPSAPPRSWRDHLAWLASVVHPLEG